jgi:tRNA-Thr(GGU) m(6)t(6)A37 methyltransferase TsaA
MKRTLTPSKSTLFSWAPIGTVKCEIHNNEVKQRRKTIISRIIVFEEFSSALKGITEYSHLLVIFWMHKRKHAPNLVSHPRGNKTYPNYGAFAYRGANHPNPVGLSVVELLARDGNSISVKGLDAFDQTPVIDIKPYDHYDIVRNPEVPEWFASRIENPAND